MVDTPADFTLFVPTPDAVTNRSIYPTFDKCYINMEDCTEDGQFASVEDFELDGVTLTDGQWVTFVSLGIDEAYDGSNQVINFAPTYTEIGEHTLIVKWTTVNGDDFTYTAITVTVECLVASFTAPTQADGSYTVYND